MTLPQQEEPLQRGAAQSEFVLQDVNDRSSLETVMWSPHYDAVHKQLARELLRRIDVASLPVGESTRPKIVCLCGSTRFYEHFQRANYEETMLGNIVLSVGFYPHAQKEMHHEEAGCTPEQKIALDELHKRKIDLADEVLVLNVGGYIGSSTRSEIDYAEAHGKPVRYLETELGLGESRQQIDTAFEGMSTDEVYQRESARLQGVGRWISVEKKLPPHNSYIMFYVPSEGEYPVTGYWRADEKRWESVESGPQNDRIDFDAEQVTHWQPLPLPPGESREQKKISSRVTPADYVLAAQKVLTYLNRECAHPPAGMALENEVGRIIHRSLEK